MSYPILKWDIEVAYYYFVALYFPLSTINVYFIYLLAPILDKWMEGCVCVCVWMLQSLCNDLHSLVTDFFWKSVFFFFSPCISSLSLSLSLTIFIEYIFLSFHLGTLHMSLKLKWISCRQHIVGSYFLSIQSLYIFCLENLLSFNSFLFMFM